MLRRDQQLRSQIQQLLDACIFAASFWLAYVLRSSDLITDLGVRPQIAPFDNYVWLYLVLIPMAPLVLESQGFYDRPLICSRRTTVWILGRSCFLITIGLILILFFFRRELPRGVPVLFGGVSFVLVMLKEELLRLGWLNRLSQSQSRRRFILVGTPEETIQMRRDIDRRPEDGMRVMEEVDLATTSISEFLNLLHEHSINGVIINTKHTYFDQTEEVIRACEMEGVEAWLVADFFSTQICRRSFDDLYGRPILVFRTAPEASWQSVSKQLLDFTASVLAIIALSWLFVLIALLVKLTSPGPVLFRQKRSGLNGHPFTMFKFRTMVTNAEQLKHELERLNEMSGPVFKVSNDPRVTPVGRFLRKFSLDELPQLFNVLRGEMSLVGPRPLPVDEVKRFDDLAHRRRLSVKPGLTCLWQISGRNNVTNFHDWVRLDLEYIDNWSIWLDLKILLRTVPIVLAGTGAR